MDLVCPGCDRSYPVQDGILMAMGELSGKNRIAEAFYNGPLFEKFRFKEQLFLWFNGGLTGARRQILRHLPPLAGGRLLEVGIGDGDNVGLLPRGVQLAGIDIARRRLRRCRDRWNKRPLTLALAEAERIPFANGIFDAVLCVGGFNFFSDPARAIEEMVRVTRSGGRIVVADEVPNFHRYGWGHRIGVAALDRWLMRRWFGAEFCEMVLTNQIDPGRLAGKTLLRLQLHRIWRGYGYCLVGSVP